MKSYWRGLLGPGALAFAFSAGLAQAAENSVAQRVEQLLARMTLKAFMKVAAPASNAALNGGR